MINERVFDNLEQLNDFVVSEGVRVVSVQDVVVKVHTDLPMMRGGSFSYDANKIKLWYETR